MKRRSSGKQQPDIIFFVDRSLGRKHVGPALRNIGEIVELHDDHFKQDTVDEEWLAEVGRRGWVVLSNDDRIRFRDIERQALIDNHVAAFILTSMNIKGSEMANAFVLALPKIKKILKKIEKPFIATVSRSGLITIKYPESDPNKEK